VVWPPQQRQSAKEAIEELMRGRGLARRFEQDVERAARRAAGDRRRDGASRRDLRELPTFTIDPPTARDFDDAISAEWIGDGEGVRVWVHIADVSAYVPEGSPVDLEARARATSVYVPGAVEPMLPEALSGDACSLVPGRDRLAVTVELELRQGDTEPIREEPAGAAFYRSLIRSDARLDYDQVDRVFAGEEQTAEPWGEPLRAARAAAAVLERARAKRPGALTLDSAEPEFVFDERGEVSEISSRIQTESHRLIEHLMIAANEAVARTLEQHGVPCLYRVHERPQAKSVERLVDQLATLGVPTPPVPKQMSRAQAAELVGEISRLVDKHVRRTTASARIERLTPDRTGRPNPDRPVATSMGGRRALSGLVLRSLQQAYYAPRNLGHAGLGSACYCHFTSPIRRYPDLVCHRALLSILGEEERPPRARGLAELGEWASERERTAMEIERDADDVARCFALEGVLYEHGWEQTFTGEVVGLISAGAFVAFGEHGANGAGEIYRYEGMLPVRRLAAAMARRDGAPREWWELNEQGTILRAERSGAVLRLGDPIAVRVGRVDALRGRVDLEPVEPDTQARPAG
jgi:ribonuclease R